MADTSNLTQFLTDVAGAIKEKTGKTDKIPAANFDTEILSIKTGGNVKLFETQETMQADTTAKEGDLATVYRSEVKNATSDSKFQVATFPDTVILDNAMTDYVEVRYRAVDSSIMFDCMGSLDSSRFRMDCYTESGQIRIQYTSSDGITYTRTDTTGNPVDFGTQIYYGRAGDWNDAIGKFIQVGGNVFEGLYKYSLTTGNYFKYTDATNNYELYSDKCIHLTTDISSGFVLVTNTIDKNHHITNGDLPYIDAVDYVIYDTTDFNGYVMLAVGSDNQAYIIASPHVGSSVLLKKEYANGVLTNTTNISTETIKTYTTIVGRTFTTSYGYELYKLNTSDIVFSLNIVGGVGGICYKYTSTLPVGDVASSTSYTLSGLVSDYLYIPAPTQLTLGNINELLPGKIAYGKNGVVTGDNSIYDNLSQEDVLTKIYGLTKTPDLDYYTGINKQTDLLLTRNIVDKYKYNMVRLKKLDNFDSNNTGIVIPLNNIKISKHNLYQFSDIIPESDLADIANSGSMILSDDGKTLGLIVLYNGNSYIIDLETHSIIKTFITRNVKLYKHKVFYATNDLTDKSSSDLNYYCYDLNTRENTIVATRPTGSVKNKYICRVNTYGRIITLLTYDRDDSTHNYPNAVNATFIDCESNQTSSMPEISWTTSGNYIGEVISCAANDGVYILVYKYKVNNPVSVIKCDLNLVTSTLLEDVTLFGDNPVVDNYYTVVGIQYNNTLMYQRFSGAYYINLTNKTGGHLSNIETIDLSSNNIAMASKDDRYYPITGIDSTNSYSLILDKSKFIPAGYERTRMYGTEVYMCLSMYETILTLEANSIAVVSWGNIVTNKFNVTLLTTVQDDTYDYIAINIGGTNSNTGPRFIPLGNANLSDSISQEEYNQALITANEIKGGNT